MIAYSERQGFVELGLEPYEVAVARRELEAAFKLSITEEDGDESQAFREMQLEAIRQAHVEEAWDEAVRNLRWGKDEV